MSNQSINNNNQSTNAVTTKSREEILTEINNRKNGFYDFKSLKEEAELSFRQMTKYDKAITLLMSHGVFSVYNKSELADQVKQWKRQKVNILPENIIPIQINNNDAFLWIIQPPNMDEDTPMSPLAMAFGVMVSGYAYISKSKEVPEKIMEEIKPKVISVPKSKLKE